MRTSAGRVAACGRLRAALGVRARVRELGTEYSQYSPSAGSCIQRPRKTSMLEREREYWCAEAHRVVRRESMAQGRRER